ncbi:unnamed protein product, partial [marine sediment metagenome]
MTSVYNPMKNIKISPAKNPKLFVAVNGKFADKSNIIVDTSGTYDTWDYNSDGTISSTYNPNFIIAATGNSKVSDIILANKNSLSGLYATWKWDSTNKSFNLVTGGTYNLMVIDKALKPNMNLIVDIAGTYDQWIITPVPSNIVPAVASGAGALSLSSSSSISSSSSSCCCLFLM